jgi:hypothetical protein
MSFMTAQEAIQTCILSNRWKNLWTTLPFLNFTLDDENGNFESVRIQNERFRCLVSTALLLREPSDLQVFHLDFENHFDSDNMCVTWWVLYVLKHNPKVLNIRILLGKVPSGVFTCSSLEDVSFTFTCWWSLLLGLLNFLTSNGCTFNK